MNNVKKINELFKLCDNIKKMVEKFDDPYTQFTELAEEVDGGKHNIQELDVILDEDMPVTIGGLIEEGDYTTMGVNVLEDGEVSVTLYSLEHADVIDKRTKFEEEDDEISYYSKDTRGNVSFEVDEDLIDKSIKGMKKLEQVVKKL